MDSNLLIILAVVVVVAIGAWLFMTRRRSDHLRSRFGSEYERQVEASGSRSKAEADLAEREKRVSKLTIRPLSPADQDRCEQQDDSALPRVGSHRIPPAERIGPAVTRGRQWRTSIALVLSDRGRRTRSQRTAILRVYDDDAPLREAALLR